MLSRFVYLILSIALPAYLFAQPRQQQTINSGWQFVLNDNDAASSVAGQDVAWKKINLPHTWNALDIIDDTVGYHQGIGWYKKQLFIPEAYAGKHIELFFEGACIQATVYVNGQLATVHKGGFTGFTVDLDNKVQTGADNTILVKVDNGKYLRDSIPPYSADFNLMGGIYRDAWMIVTSPQRFKGLYDSKGVLFETTRVSDQKAGYNVTAFFAENTAPLNGSVEYSLYQNNALVTSGNKSLKNFKEREVVIPGIINSPKLWTPEQPERYELVVRLKDKNGELLDELRQKVGFKWVGISSSKEFLLNGKPYKLKGASRHQDFKNVGTALTDAMHIRDIELMKEMGCNFIRIAHYPQDPVVYEACDRLGLIAWNEIPVVDRLVDNPTFFENSAAMMHEMIYQNFNHPSIAIWGFHNEVRNLEPATIRHAKMLDSIARTIGGGRLTAMAYESNVDVPYFSSPLLKDILNITDINGYNVYQGWYRGGHHDIGKFLDTLYAFNADKPILLSEYGAGSIINMHTYQDQTSLFDFSEEYQYQYHQSYVEAGNTKPWMIGFAIWNFIDFQRDGREDVVPNINKKGVVTTDREPKDVYYYYKAQWSTEPFIYITGKHWPQRVLPTNSDDAKPFTITVFSNQPDLLLSHNGKDVGQMHSSDGTFEWTVPLKEGLNQLICKTPGNQLADMLEVHCTFLDTTSFSTNNNWNQLNFNTGQTRTFFNDPISKEQWLPDKRYSKGSYGYVNGAVWNTWPSAAWNGIREGIHRPIANTDNEPLFQTFVQDLTAWKADVPAGNYLVTILLAEPFTNAQRNKTDRVMTISLNGELWMQNLDIEKTHGVQTAVILDRIITVKGNEGITIDFTANNGKTILNGVSLKRM